MPGRWQWTLRIERKWADAWIGAYWRTLSCMGYEIDGSLPIRYSKRGTPYQVTNFDLWVCIIPCFPIHLKMWR